MSSKSKSELQSRRKCRAHYLSLSSPESTGLSAATLVRTVIPGSRSEEGKVGGTVLGHWVPNREPCEAGPSLENLQKWLLLGTVCRGRARGRGRRRIYLSALVFYCSTSQLLTSGHQIGPHKVWPSASTWNLQGRRHKAHRMGMRPGATGLGPHSFDCSLFTVCHGSRHWS